MPDPVRHAAQPPPDMIRFRDGLAVAYGRHPALHSLPVAEARAVAEAVRAPWASGGPSMHESRDLSLEHDGMALRLRVHRPRPANDGVLVYVHGGGWTLFSLDTHDRVMREYAAGTGLTVIGIDYTLVPEAVFPRQLDEVAALLRLLHGGGGEAAFGFSTAGLPLAIGGDSAGANLAMAAALTLRDTGLPDALQALLLNYAAVDPDAAGASTRLYDGPDFNLTREEMRNFWAGYLPDATDRADPRAALLRGGLHGLPPCFLAIAECDVLRDENLALAAALREAGVAVRAEQYDGMLHSFLEAVSISPTAARAFRESGDWLAGIVRHPRGLAPG